MAKSLNRVDLLGYLGTDANIKEIADGTSVGEVSVSTDYSVKDASGKWTERTEWHSVVIWGAASASEVLVKGARVHLTGDREAADALLGRGRREAPQDGGRVQRPRRDRHGTAEGRCRPGSGSGRGTGR